MNKDFQSIVDQMDPLLERLQSSPLLTRDKRERLPDEKGVIPCKGVYVLYEEGKPIYVGRANGIRKRLYQHGQKGIQATFAIKLLRESLGIKADYSTEKSTKALTNRYKCEFKDQIDRVKKMSFRVVEIEDPRVQYIFEVYATLALETTRYNTFDTT